MSEQPTRLVLRAAFGLAWVGAWVLARSASADATADPSSAAKVGRPVRVVSLSFRKQPLERVVDAVDREASRGADLIALPETFRGNTPETLDGPAVTALSKLARRHRTYVVCPIYRWEGKRRYNSAILLDREGKVACVYDKVYPYWSEFDLTPPCSVGTDVPVHQADFGRVGMGICFDANFPRVWKELAENGAELVIWPSAYSAGTTLQAHALVNHFYIVTATWRCDCVVYDITGEEIHYSKGKETDIHVARLTLDLDRGIYHQNFNTAKRDKLLREHGREVIQEKYLDREQWFVLRARRPGVSARGLGRRYGLEELRDYIDRSRREIDRRRRQSVVE